jgi:hypothetical protein
LQRLTLFELIRTQNFWFMSLCYEIAVLLLAMSQEMSLLRGFAIFLTLFGIDLANRWISSLEPSFNQAFALRLLSLQPLAFIASFEMPEKLFYVPIITLIVQMLITQLAKIKWWTLAVLGPLGLGTMIFYMQQLQQLSDQESIRLGSNLTLFAGLGIFVTYLFFKSQREVEAKLVSVRSLNDFMNFRIQIVMHDLLNRVHGLSACYHENDLENVLNRVERFQNEANQLIRSLRNEKREWVPLRTFCMEYYRDSDDFKLLVQTQNMRNDLRINRRSIQDILQNLIENAVEAGLSKGIEPVIRMEWKNPTLILTDNCGGFDLKSIKSSKGEEHGVFLRRIFLNPEISHMLGYRPEVQSVYLGEVRIGTRMLLHFTSKNIRLHLATATPETHPQKHQSPK